VTRATRWELSTDRADRRSAGSARSSSADESVTAPAPAARGGPDWQSAAELAQPRGLPGFDDGIVLEDLLAALPRDRREAFVLTQILGLPYDEAAERSDCPVGTVRSRVARARATPAGLLSEADEPAVLAA
jgi:RNA polymerase sigma-70 factor (ECF subfamily)